MPPGRKSPPPRKRPDKFSQTFFQDPTVLAKPQKPSGFWGEEPEFTSGDEGVSCKRPPQDSGGLPEWPKGAGCKPAGVRLRWFKSNTHHQHRTKRCHCGSSSVGRASAFQAECREFESRLPLRGLKASYRESRIESALPPAGGRRQLCSQCCLDHESRLPLRGLRASYRESRIESALPPAGGRRQLCSQCCLDHESRLPLSSFKLRRPAGRLCKKGGVEAFWPGNETERPHSSVGRARPW